MPFSSILKAVRKEYSLSCCAIADHREIEDEEVDKWLNGTSFPSEKEAKDFSALFALPYSVVWNSIQEGMKQNETDTDHSGL